MASAGTCCVSSRRRTRAERNHVNTRRSVPLVVVVWVVVGCIVAGSHHFFDNLHSLGPILTAILAVLLWPLILLGVKISIS